MEKIKADTTANGTFIKAPNGKVYRVKSTVRKVKQGDKFYTYEVQEMELIEERGANPNREGETPHNGNTSNNSITSAKLLNGVKRTNINEDILQYSKIVDENGEPKVVYHLMSMMQAANLPQRTRLNLQMSLMKQMQ